MQVIEPKTTLGIYSDSSAVYINACILKTDGLDILTEPVSLTRSYSPELRQRLLSLRYPDDFTNSELLAQLNKDVTHEHISVAEELIQQVSRPIPQIDVIGYSGHVVHYELSDKRAVILGNGDELALKFKTPVIDRFVQTDLQAGGVGGPLLTTFYEAITREQEKPLAIVSLSGVSTLIYIGQLGEQYAFDIGVGCLLLDRWLQRHVGLEMDFNGEWGEKGKVDERLLAYLLKTPYLLQNPPKRLDRNDFNHLLEHVEGLSPADGAATLTAFIVKSILNAQKFLPNQPKHWILTGGGTLNPAIVLRLKRALTGRVSTVSEIQMPHYNLDAAGYGFLAVRSMMRLPITFPTTSGVKEPITGGLYHSGKME